MSSASWTFASEVVFDLGRALRTLPQHVPAWRAPDGVAHGPARLVMVQLGGRRQMGRHPSGLATRQPL